MVIRRYRILDGLFFFRHSSHSDFEIKCALRGIAKYMPWMRKVWVFGDKPSFLSVDRSVIEHVPHEYVARVGKYRTPITNFFMMYYLSSLIPELDFEYLWFCDDFFTVGELSIEDARKDRYIVDMDQAKRQTGLWNESLWRTYDFLKRLGYTRYNFEIHAPTYLSKKRVFDAYCDFRDFVTQDRWYGMLGPTAILNHAVTTAQSDLVQRDREGRWLGYYGDAPAYDTLLKKAEGKTFLNFDDRSLTEDVRRYLSELFPDPCKYETPTATTAQGAAIHSDVGDWYPPIVLPSRAAFPEMLNELGLVGEGVEVGTLVGKYAEVILDKWTGNCLHCVDPWEESGDKYFDRNNLVQDRHDQNYETAITRLQRFGERCQLHRLASIEAASRFRTHSLDFVYLDARHYYDAVIQDIEAWFPKVRPGGILAGHDYLDGVLPSGQFGVKSAVDDWAAKHGYRVACTGENVWRSWLIRLPDDADAGMASDTQA